MKPCKTKFPIHPLGTYAVQYECGYVEVTLDGVSVIYTSVVNFNATTIILANSSGEGIYDIASTGIDPALATESVFCNSAATTEPYTWTITCTDQGNKLLRIEKATGSTAVFNLDGTPSSAVTQECGAIESDSTVICAAGTQALMWVVKNEGVPTGEVYFTDANGQVIPTPPLYTLGKCLENTCTPTISDANGNDLSTLLPGTNFIITKPDCCKIQVVTSVGTFTLKEKETYYATTDFNCLITINSVSIVSGSCTLQNVHIISNNKGI